MINLFFITDERGISPAPAYDMVNTRLVIPEKEDPDEPALTLGGRHRKLHHDDFEEASLCWRLTETQIIRVFWRFAKQLPATAQLIETFFLPGSLRRDYRLGTINTIFTVL